MHREIIPVKCELIKIIRIHVEWRYCGCCDGDHLVIRVPASKEQELISILANRLVKGGEGDVSKAYFYASYRYILSPVLPDGFTWEPEDDDDVCGDELTSPTEDLAKTRGWDSVYLRKSILVSSAWKEAVKVEKTRIAKIALEKEKRFRKEEKERAERERVGERKLYEQLRKKYKGEE
jgi:hypothetical protein